MKPACFQIGKKLILLQKIQNLSDDLCMILALILSINKDVIYVNYGKNIELLGRDFIDIILEANRSTE